ncbi:MAG: DUF554 domain-containing protein [Oscillospiraceae bacterium]
MIGTLINAAGIIIGGAIGLLLKNVIPKRLESPVIVAEGVGLMFITASGVLTRMLSFDGEKLVSQGELLLLISLVVGTVIGELLNIDKGLNTCANWLENKFKVSGFSNGFISASLIFCVGAMTIMGPINEVVNSDMSVLQIKALLDTVTSMLLAVTLGWGVLFAAVPVLAIQGMVALFANSLCDMPQQMMSDIGMVGYAMIACIAINFILKKDIKTANMLPALVIPLIYNLIK